MSATCFRIARLNFFAVGTSGCGGDRHFVEQAVSVLPMNESSQRKGELILAIAASLSALGGCKVEPNLTFFDFS
jgi:hypothetical protein